MTALPADTPAPDFTLLERPGATFQLSAHRGHPVVLVFYPADWSPVCGDQLALYSELADEFARYEAEVVGISVDGVWSHVAFREARRYRLTLVSDFEPKGEVARRYGVYNDRAGTSARALFVLDAGGVIRWSYVSPDEINPGADGILEALDSLSRRSS